MVVEEATTTTDAKQGEEVAKKPAKAARKKAKKTVSNGVIHIYASFNNTIISVSDTSGNVLTSSSAGACGFRGSKKGTAYAAQIASEKAVTMAKQQFGLAKADVLVRGIGLGRESAIRALQNAEIMVESITDITTIPHGGVRPKNPRKG